MECSLRTEITWLQTSQGPGRAPLPDSDRHDLEPVQESVECRL
jgi:hypothetical protein